MYLGRIVAIGMTPEGNNMAMYRVSSRSFPNREAVKINDTIAIMPKKGFEGDLSKNPYIAYNCIRYTDKYVLASNGSHTDPIIEKIAQGMPVRDALTLGLLAMDYEKDDYDTPRIAAVVSRTEPVGYLGVVRKDGIAVTEFELKPGVSYYVSTYEHNTPSRHYKDEQFCAKTPEAACQFILKEGVYSKFLNPVTATVAMVNGSDVEFALADV